MITDVFEIPKRLAAHLKAIGPIHEETAGDYLYAVRVVAKDDDVSVGFIVEQRLAERALPAAEGAGLSSKVPARADSRVEATFVFVETLTGALDYIRGQTPANG